MNLEQILYQYIVDDLKKLAKFCGGSSKLTRKDDLVRFLCAELLSLAKLKQHWTQLDELSQKAVASAYHNEGEFDADAFAAQYGKLRERPQSRWYYQQEAIPLDLFLHHGHIPTDLMPLLAEIVPPPERFQATGVAEAPATIIAYGEAVTLRRADTEDAGLHDLALFLRLVDQGQVKYSTSSARLTPSSAHTLLDNLLQGDFFAQTSKSDPKELIRPFGLAVFAQESGLVSKSYSRNTLTERGRAYLQTEDPELLLEAFEAWSNEGEFDELTRLTELKGFRTRGLRLSSPARRRTAIVEALSWCPAGVWISIGEFYRALRVWHLAVPIEEAGYGSLYYGYRYPYEPWADSQSYWLLTQGLYANVLLWEYLGSIGALDLLYVSENETELAAEAYYYDEDSFSRYDGLAYFRINPLGAFLFGQADNYQQVQVERAPLFHVNPDLTLTLHDPAALTPNLLHQLVEVATPTGDQTYRLDQTQLLAAFEAGSEPQLIGGFLQEHNDGPLPPAVETWLAQTYENSRAVSIASRALLIKVRSSDLLDQLLADTVIGKFANRLNPKTLVIPAGKESALRNRVRELGYGVRT